LCIVSIRAFAQVANDNIEERLQLEFNKPVVSSTAGANVQWKCINKALTNKCLVYHNDQWFSFTTGSAGDYFINLGSQKCRDSRGVQLIIIEGNPCEVSTYKILECIPQIRTEDVFVDLHALKANTQYLVNVDGFLGDFCQFNIELSDKPKGLPRKDVNLDTLKFEAHIDQKVVTMNWTIDEKLAREISEFIVFRNSLMLAEISKARNAYGSTRNDYRFIDTLTVPGTYSYNIYGVQESSNVPLLLSQRKISLQPEKVSNEKEVIKVLPVRLHFKEKETFQLRLYNYDGDHLLWKHAGESQGEGELFMIDPQPYVAYGLKKFQLLVLDVDGKRVDEMYFRVDPDGSITKD
jgi:hypothetical protein